MAGYGIIGTVTLLGNTEQEILNQLPLYEKKRFYTQGPIWTTDKAPRWRKHGKYACVISFMDTDDCE